MVTKRSKGKRKKYTYSEVKAYSMGYGYQCGQEGSFPFIGEKNISSYRRGEQAARDRKTSPCVPSKITKKKN